MLTQQLGPQSDSPLWLRALKIPSALSTQDLLFQEAFLEVLGGRTPLLQPKSQHRRCKCTHVYNNAHFCDHLPHPALGHGRREDLFSPQALWVPQAIWTSPCSLFPFTPTHLFPGCKEMMQVPWGTPENPGSNSGMQCLLPHFPSEAVWVTPAPPKWGEGVGRCTE